MSQGLIKLKMIPETLRLSRKKILNLEENPISDHDYPKTFARSTSFNNFYKKVYLNYHKEKHSPSISGVEEELKNSIHPYEDYQELIKPKLKPMNSLCPFQTISCRISKKKAYLINPKQEYNDYKLESQKMLTRSRFRISKTKEMIISARYMTNKILRESLMHNH
jgi:hypothetical protein